MESLARLDWLTLQINSGRSTCVRFSYNPARMSEKITFILEPWDGAHQTVYRPAVLGTLMSLRAAIPDCIVTDKGHSHKSHPGKTFVEFWMKPALSGSTARVDVASATPEVDQIEQNLPREKEIRGKAGPGEVPSTSIGILPNSLGVVPRAGGTGPSGLSPVTMREEDSTICESGCSGDVDDEFVLPTQSLEDFFSGVEFVPSSPPSKRLRFSVDDEVLKVEMESVANVRERSSQTEEMMVSVAEAIAGAERLADNEASRAARNMEEFKFLFEQQTESLVADSRAQIASMA